MNAKALCLVVVAAAMLAGGLPAGAQERVGVDSAVNAQAHAVLPGGGVTRQVKIGDAVLFNERFATDAGGQTQLLFLDQSAMTIGPNSDVTIDEFAYNPASGTGRLAMSASRGILRFVGGKLSKNDNAVGLRTLTATLAVRGGAFLADLSSNGRLDVYFVYGDAVSVTGTNGVVQQLRRPGFAITVNGPGASPSAPYPAPIGALARLLAALDGRPGASGGTRNPPSPATIASSGIGNAISSIIQASTLPVLNQPVFNTANLQINTAVAQSTPAIALLEGNPNIGSNPTTTPTTTQTSYPIAAFAVIDPATVFGSRAKAGIKGELVAAVLQNGVLTASASNAAVSLPLAPGFNTIGPQGTASTFGPVTGSGYLAPDDAFFYAEGTSASQPGKIGVLAGGVPTVNLPTTGIGSYSGSVTGLVNNNGSIYVANGGFTNVYNFATNSGTFTISNFDSHTLSGSVAAIGGVNGKVQAQLAAAGVPSLTNIGNLVYGGTLTGNGLKGAVGGAFFGSGASDTGGGFGVSSPSGAYKAGGVFGGNR